MSELKAYIIDLACDAIDDGTFENTAAGWHEALEWAEREANSHTEVDVYVE